MRVLVLLAGGYGVIHGRITLGVLTAFMEYTSKITCRSKTSAGSATASLLRLLPTRS